MEEFHYKVHSLPPLARVLPRGHLEERQKSIRSTFILISVLVAISAPILFVISILMGLAYEFRTHSWHAPPNFPTSCHGAVQGQFQFSLQGRRQRRGTLNEVLGSSPDICWNEVLGSSPDMCSNDVLGSCPDMRLNEVLRPSPNMHWNEVAGSSPDICLNEIQGSSPDMCLNEVLGSCPDARLKQVLESSPDMCLNEFPGASPDICLNGA